MILLTGSTGMIGSNLKELLPPMLTPTHAELELTDAFQTREYLRANKPEGIIHCASNDEDICLYDNLRMFENLAKSGIPMIIFCTGREIEDRSYKNGEYVLSKHMTKELALSKYKHIKVIQIWGCFGRYERPIRFLAANIQRVKEDKPIQVYENRLFSYVYVNDLAEIVEREAQYIERGLLQVVGYTQPLSVYGEILKEVSGSPHPVKTEKEDFYHSYVGVNTYHYDYTPLREAIKRYWEASNAA